MENYGMGFTVRFLCDGREISLGDGYGLNLTNAERLVESFEYQGIEATIHANEWVEPGTETDY